MYSTSDFRKGLKLLIDNEPYAIVDFQHVKPGKGNQFTRTKLRNILTGSNLERTIKSGEKFPPANVETKDCQFLYKDDSGFHFMIKETYDQIAVQSEDLGDAVHYLTENLECTMLYFNERPIGADVPNTVKLKVVQTDPGFKGNTVTGTFKPATLETGFIVQVPLHINEGDFLKIDTRTGVYIERVNK